MDMGMEVYIPPVKVSYDFGKVVTSHLAGCDLFDQFMALIAT